MEKILIALYGVANVGKSTTLMKVRDLLRSRQNCVVESEGMLETEVDIRVVLRINGVMSPKETQWAGYGKAWRCL